MIYKISDRVLTCSACLFCFSNCLHCLQDEFLCLFITDSWKYTTFSCRKN